MEIGRAMASDLSGSLSLFINLEVGQAITHMATFRRHPFNTGRTEDEGNICTYTSNSVELHLLCLGSQHA